MRSLFLLILCCCLSAGVYSQLYFKSTLKTSREKMFRNLVQNSINKNLSVPLTDSTEETWQGAFWALELLQYKSLWINGRIDLLAEQMNARSEPFQRAALELLYSNYPGKYYDPVKFLLMQTNSPKIFAMCAVYMLNSARGLDDVNFLAVKTKQQLVASPEDPILLQLLYQLENFQRPFTRPAFESLLSKNYLPGHTIVYSFQRKNRNYPGIVMVRDASGNFVMDSTGLFFSVPQLARSLSNLPGYLSNGNTPEGIFRMKGYDVSTNGFIGPTVNVQLTMPFEKSPGHFYADSTITDTTWNIAYYRNLLPKNLKDHYPLYQSYYAGKAGRTEIIIHGTTVSPAFYTSQPYYPLTPTMGCLTSKEIWNEDNGQRMESDQQKLINALIQAGGPHGYAIVVNIDDEQRPVALYDIVPLIEKANAR